MAANLDFSTGKEHRVSVQVSGWTKENKASFAAAAKALPGVIDVRSAGGGVSYSIWYDANRITENALEEHLTRVVESVLGSLPQRKIAERSSPSSITIDGEHITIDGGVLDGGTFDSDHPAENETAASNWTGVTDIRERAAAVRLLVPTALAAIEAMILELDVLGGNGGPPLEDRKEAIDALRGLHSALGSLLALVETPNFQWADQEGLASSCVSYFARLQRSLRNDPLPYAAAGLILTICTTLSFPGAGALLATFAFDARKRERK